MHNFINYFTSYFEHISPIYVYIIIFAFITLESAGILVPAESLLIFASLYAAHTHHLNILILFILAMSGAIIGDNTGYLIGHFWGWNLLKKHGRKIGINNERLLVGRYLAKHFGCYAVILGRFVAFLRIFIAILSGIIHMPWHSFLFANAIGATLWAYVYTFIIYKVGDIIESFKGTTSLVLSFIIFLCVIFLFYLIKKNEKKLIKKALKEMSKEGNNIDIMGEQ